MIAADEKTFTHLQGRTFAPTVEQWPAAIASWHNLRSDPGAHFDSELHVDASAIAPMVTWGTNPAHAIAVTGRVPSLEQSGTSREAYERALTYMDLQPGVTLSSLKIDAAFIGSCTNSRLSDLRRAAGVLQGRHVAPGVKAICVPGSTRVKHLAEQEGLEKIFKNSGFEWREAGCSMCFYAGGEASAIASGWFPRPTGILRAAGDLRHVHTSRARKLWQRVLLPVTSQTLAGCKAESCNPSQ